MLRYVPEGGASPMESIVALLLSLPTSLGGYGLPVPRMNASLSVPQTLRHVGHRAHVMPDLLWESSKVFLEYDSDMHHVGADRIASDARRRDALLGMGYSVVTRTRTQYNDVREFDQLAKMLARLMGLRVRVRRKDFAEQRDKTRYLLGSGHLIG